MQIFKYNQRKKKISWWSFVQIASVLISDNFKQFCLQDPIVPSTNVLIDSYVWKHLASWLLLLAHYLYLLLHFSEAISLNSALWLSQKSAVSIQCPFMFIGSASSFCLLNFINLFQSFKNEKKSKKTQNPKQLSYCRILPLSFNSKIKLISCSFLLWAIKLWCGLLFWDLLWLSTGRTSSVKISASESPKKHSLGKNLELFVCSIL